MVYFALKEAVEADCRDKADFLRKSAPLFLHASLVAPNIIIVDKYNLVALVFALFDSLHYFIQIVHLIILVFFPQSAHKVFLKETPLNVDVPCLKCLCQDLLVSEAGIFCDILGH